MRIERTRDAGLVRLVITHPRIYPHWTHDYRPKAEEFQPNMSEAMNWLAIKHGNEVLGVCLVFSVLSPLIWQIEHAILPIAWHQTDAIGTLLEDWLFTNTPCETAIGFIPDNNKLSCKYAERRGMMLSGEIPAGYPKGGKKYNLRLYVKKRAIM